MLYGNDVPISGQADSRESVPYKEKRTLPGASADVSWFVCVAALDPEGSLSVAGFGNINPIPFRYVRATPVVRGQCLIAPLPNGVFLSLRTD